MNLPQAITPNWEPLQTIRARLPVPSSRRDLANEVRKLAAAGRCEVRGGFCDKQGEHDPQGTRWGGQFQRRLSESRNP